ncbi:uncharacterized protein LOC143017626 isoform X2 [Oratosquilla oratoria]|uniref:uncharacterized protein LOC143017626 isoform X2 n=1 Tax=Oratosquilla oratoria TaxID=337810 RepID=UPI003F75B4CF
MLPTLYDGLHGVIYRVQCQPTELNTPTGGDQAEGVLRPVEGPGAPRGTLRDPSKEIPCTTVRMV